MGVIFWLGKGTLRDSDFFGRVGQMDQWGRIGRFAEGACQPNEQVVGPKGQSGRMGRLAGWAEWAGQPKEPVKLNGLVRLVSGCYRDLRKLD